MRPNDVKLYENYLSMGRSLTEFDCHRRLYAISADRKLCVVIGIGWRTSRSFETNKNVSRTTKISGSVVKSLKSSHTHTKAISMVQTGSHR